MRDGQRDLIQRKARFSRRHSEVGVPPAQTNQ
jgi:hypothetical protein